LDPFGFCGCKVRATQACRPPGCGLDAGGVGKSTRAGPIGKTQSRNRRNGAPETREEM